MLLLCTPPAEAVSGPDHVLRRAGQEKSMTAISETVKARHLIVFRAADPAEKLFT
jgi:hypothetical protein